ncbi:hypothetical protein C8Q73DRAFT_372541 [Cubamyces lactineus]|nr:hypothetical protein C8Q73DRAFT_372541 [Cubamyces lactineus]
MFIAPYYQQTFGFNLTETGCPHVCGGLSAVKTRSIDWHRSSGSAFSRLNQCAWHAVNIWRKRAGSMEIGRRGAHVCDTMAERLSRYWLTGGTVPRACMCASYYAGRLCIGGDGGGKEEEIGGESGRARIRDRSGPTGSDSRRMRGTVLYDSPSDARRTIPRSLSRLLSHIPRPIPAAAVHPPARRRLQILAYFRLLGSRLDRQLYHILRLLGS